MKKIIVAAILLTIVGCTAAVPANPAAGSDSGAGALTRHKGAAMSG
jgi:hypothetical protein